MDLNLKYTASKVDEIEQIKKVSIENCISDTTINGICLFLQKGLVDDNGNHGVSKNVAMSKLDEFLGENDKDELLLQITEALISGGFLSREIDVNELRKMKKKRVEEAKKAMRE